MTEPALSRVELMDEVFRQCAQRLPDYQWGSGGYGQVGAVKNLDVAWIYTIEGPLTFELGMGEDNAAIYDDHFVTEIQFNAGSRPNDPGAMAQSVQAAASTVIEVFRTPSIMRDAFDTSVTLEEAVFNGPFAVPSEENPSNWEGRASLTMHVFYRVQ